MNINSIQSRQDKIGAITELIQSLVPSINRGYILENLNSCIDRELDEILAAWIYQYDRKAVGLD